MDAYQDLVNNLNKVIAPLSDPPNYNSLVDKIGDARFVLIGEATHGTYEFYQARIEITKQLIEKKGFMAVAIEGDWPDTYAINRYIQGKGDKENTDKVLATFDRFPAWMWRNEAIPPFIKWLRNYNDAIQNPKEKIGFFGLDLYSLHKSLHAVIKYLNKVDPEAAKKAITRYACFDHAKIDAQTYGYLVSTGIKKSCIKEATEELLELQRKALEYIHEDKVTAEDEYFYATQNARIVKDAEKYYRAMYEGQISSWNIRDKHMADTLNVIADHLESKFNKPAKIVVWAHNSHIGDARATEVLERGELNIGQLVREEHAQDTYLIGFSTYKGTVTAASEWDGFPERKVINPGFESSYEELFHDLQYKNFLLDLRANKQLEHLLEIPRLQRAIGVIYLPETERLSHYFFVKLPYQFDSIIHFDETRAIMPL